MSENFRELEHTADLCIRIQGETLPDLFTHAAQGMFALMGGLSDRQVTTSRIISLTSYDHEGLLIDWLSELLYLSEHHGEVYSAFAIQINEPIQLAAQADGHGSFVPERGIKAVTYSNLRIIQTNPGYQVTITFDV